MAAAEEQQRPWRFRVVNVQELLAPLDLWRRVTGKPIEATYNELVRSDHTRFLVPTLRFMQFLIRLLRGRLRRLVERELRARPPALALSLMPNFNAVLRDAVRQALPGSVLLRAADRLRGLPAALLDGARPRPRDRGLGPRGRPGARAGPAAGGDHAHERAW